MKEEPNVDAKAVNQKQDLNSSAMPFFSRFLETQLCEEISEQESQLISGGLAAVTLKYPSDQEDGNGAL
ncbi:MAG: microviridin/marinostatin family tricyclic proteinase inhibitor [Nostoc sp. ChiSLP01]|nr:microviridin/marinostatin family tricyclic proteinase inhibitor [Nostoc sp. CmiSLP01]MDZ8282684.1 microviridin/marinostatin family tricyclic proteinase inhibitor [Nostoc sp. ChiSLP01]